MKFSLPRRLIPPKLSHMSGRPRPMRDWYLLILTCAIALGLSLVWNTYYFFRVTVGEANQSGMTDEKSPQEILIEDVRGVLGERRAEEARYRSEYQFIDPSK